MDKENVTLGTFVEYGDSIVVVWSCPECSAKNRDSAGFGWCDCSSCGAEVKVLDVEQE